MCGKATGEASGAAGTLGLLGALTGVGYASMLLSVGALDGVEAAEKWDPLGAIKAARGIGLLPPSHTGGVLKLVPPEAAVTQRVFLDVAIDGQAAGRVLIGLYGKDAPATAKNFQGLCAGAPHPKRAESWLRYQGSPLHRIIPGFMIQGGDVTCGNGTGGCSIYGGSFRDEPAALQLTHRGPGVLSMANRGPNTQTSQFFICTAAAPHLDGKHAVFGCVLEGAETLEALEALGTRSGRPSGQAVVTGCGVLGTEGA